MPRAPGGVKRILDGPKQPAGPPHLNAGPRALGKRAANLGPPLVDRAYGVPPNAAVERNAPPALPAHQVILDHGRGHPVIRPDDDKLPDAAGAAAFADLR